MEADKQSWEAVCQFMAVHAGVHLAETQAYLMDARLQPVAKELGLASVAAFVAAACHKTAPLQYRGALIEAMTTHETSFFRDASFWRTMEDVVLPRLEKIAGPQVRVLSTACSHGQEVYSLLILLSERFPSLFSHIEVVASDIAEASLSRARAGVFSNVEVNRGLTAPRLLRHFEKAPGGFRVKEELRKKIRFEVHNLLDPLPPSGQFSLILCRNVLIYFEPPVRARVLGHLLRGVHKNGFIGLGTGELYLGSPLPGGLYDQQQSKGVST